MIYLRIPTFPPSSNQAYATIRGTNKRVLTKEGQAYKIATTTHIVRSYPKELASVKPDEGYTVAVRFHFDEPLINKGWPKTAKTKFKKFDVSNRLKLLEDALKDACGIDDAQHLNVLIMKVTAKEKPFTEVWMWEASKESPLDGVFAHLDKFPI